MLDGNKDVEVLENGKIEEENPQGEPEKKTDPEEKKTYTDEEVNEIINKKFAAWQEKKDKELSEAKKLAEMNAQQKAEYERDKLQEELQELKKANVLNEMEKTARSMLNERGIVLPDQLTSILVTEEAESTNANVDTFAELFQAAVESAVTEKLKRKTPDRMNDSEDSSINQVGSLGKRLAERSSGRGLDKTESPFK